MRIFFLLLIAILLPAIGSATPIYKIKGPGGVVTFTSKKPAEGVSAEVFTAKSTRVSVIRGMARLGRGKLFRDQYDEIIAEASLLSGVASSLLRAVIHAESGFNPRAISHKGAIGLMQIMPGTARELGVRNALDPSQNINGGARHLASLIERYNGNLRLALAAYNAGAGAVEEFNGIPPFSETVTYVQKVLDLKHRYDAGA